MIISFISIPCNYLYSLSQDEETLLDAAIFGDEDVVEKYLRKILMLIYKMMLEILLLY